MTEQEIVELAEHLVSLREFARLAGVETITIKRWIRENGLPAYRCGAGHGRICIDRRSLAMFVRPLDASGDVA